MPNHCVHHYIKDDGRHYVPLSNPLVCSECSSEIPCLPRHHRIICPDRGYYTQKLLSNTVLFQDSQCLRPVQRVVRLLQIHKDHIKRFFRPYLELCQELRFQYCRDGSSSWTESMLRCVCVYLPHSHWETLSAAKTVAVLANSFATPMGAVVCVCI